MKIIELVESGAVPIYYFAYGMLTDPDYMGSAELIGAAILLNFEFELLQYANVVANSGSRVGGSLWAIDRRLLSELDMIEGYPTLYDRKTVPVFVGNKKYAAEVYVMTPQTRRDLDKTRPSKSYIDRIIKGYKHAGVDLGQLTNALVSKYNKEQH